MKNIHIGYGDSATGCILEALKIHGLPGDGAVPSRDDFTQGPVSESLTPSGVNQRIEYWKLVDRKLGFRFDADTFYNNSMKILDDLQADEITLWVGDSCHDILATGWLISYLEGKNFKWFIVNLTNVEEGDFIQGSPAVNLAMYTPTDIVRLYKYRKPLDAKDKTYFKSKWNKASIENSQYRVQNGGDIISVNEDYFDEYILSHLSVEYELASKFIGRILSDGKHRISDTTVEWNIRKMIDSNLISSEGDLTSMTSYSIRKKV